jgi:hypothetical protein
LLKAGREDLQVQVSINFVGIQLDAGDIVTVTSANYGWVAKPYRIFKVVQSFNDDGSISVQLNMSEYNATVYDDVSITAFQLAPNTGLGDPTFFGTSAAVFIINNYPTAINPYFTVRVTTSQAGITQYAEVWYSAFPNPLEEQMYFAGTSEVQSSGTPWSNNFQLPVITLNNIPAGNWYIFSRMVNSLASSAFSPASILFQWRPTTFQYVDKYLSIAYGTDLAGAGFSLTKTTQNYYGLCNQDSTTPSTVPSEYTWYEANPDFSSVVFLLYSNRTGRKFSFATGFAEFAAGTGAFVPTQTLLYDPSTWGALISGINIIDLDQRTGQLTKTGTTTVGTGQVQITNNTDGNMIASLQQYLDFGGPYQKTASVANLTIDIYGRVVGFEEPDEFYYSEQYFTATSGQTVFSVTRGAGYISGQCWVFRNGLKLLPTEYTDTGGATGTITLATGALTGDMMQIVSYKSENVPTGVYASFTTTTVTLSNQGSYTAAGGLVDGFELLFLNGTLVTAQDYNISGQTITFIDNTTGTLEIIIWSANNLTVANGTPVNVDAFTVIGQTIYSFSYNSLAFNLYSNGVSYRESVDFTTATGTYTLTTAPLVNTIIMTQQTFARTGAV